MKQETLLGKTIFKKDADKDSFEDATKYITEKIYSEEEPYTNVQQKSLELNKQFVNSMDSESLDNIMSEFDEPKMYSEEDIKKVLLDIILVNPVHLSMLRSGYGKFPDTYEITEKGADYIIEQFKK